MPQILKSEPAGISRARRGRSARVGSALSEINVIPLVDVMLVMLIIFMVTAPLMHRGVDVALPEARRADPISADRVWVTVPLSFRDDGRIQIADEPVSLDVLQERIRQEMETRTDKDVYLSGDATITYQELMTVMDELKDGGVENVALVSDVPRERR